MLRHLVGICCLLGVFASPLCAHADTAQLTLGTTAHLALDKGDVQNCAITLAPGDYYAVLDAKVTDNQSDEINITLSIPKPDGTIDSPSLIDGFALDIEQRFGGEFHVAKKHSVRMRLTQTHDTVTDYWLTILPKNNMTLLPFRGEEKPLDATIGDDGVSGDLDPNTSVYYKVTLPAGKWNISAEFTDTSGDDVSAVLGRVALLDRYGIETKRDFITLNELTKSLQQEASLTEIRPKPIVLRVVNKGRSKTCHYHLVITKATN